MSKESDSFDPIRETLHSSEVEAYFSRSIISPMWRDDLDDVAQILQAILLLFAVEGLVIDGAIGVWTILIPSFFHP